MGLMDRFEKWAKEGERKAREAAKPPAVDFDGRPLIELRKVNVSQEATELVPVVGESFFQEQISHSIGRRGTERIERGSWAYLWPEDKNPHDSNAVAVTFGEFQVGYLSRNDALDYRPAVDVARNFGGLISCLAKVRGAASGEYETTNAGVTLELPDPDRTLWLALEAKNQPGARLN